MAAATEQMRNMVGKAEKQPELGPEAHPAVEKAKEERKP
jgi:hypothetical protein